jgi:hypothetical protein
MPVFCRHIIRISPPVFASFLSSTTKHQVCFLLIYYVRCFIISLPAHDIFPLGLTFPVTTLFIPLLTYVLLQLSSSFFFCYVLSVSNNYPFDIPSPHYLSACIHTSFLTATTKAPGTCVHHPVHEQVWGRLNVAQSSKRVIPAYIFSHSELGSGVTRHWP